MTTSPFTFPIALLLLLGAMISAGAQGMAPRDAYAPVPANGVITLTDYGFRDWGPELVHYTLDTQRFKPGKLVLLDGKGQAVPFQVTPTAERGTLLSFVAAVKQGQTSTYTLQASPKDRAGEHGTLLQQKKGGSVEVGNEYFTLALPRPARKSFRTPVAADQVPAPIQRWKQAGCNWAGGAHFATARKVTGYEIRCLDEGPASVTYQARYHFAPKGEYAWQVRVSAGVPVAVISEDFDFGEITEGHDFLMLGLGENWQPEQIGFQTGENVTMHNVLEPLPAYLERRKAEGNKAVSNVSSKVPPEIYKPADGMVLLDKISATGTWGPKGGVNLRAAKKDGGACDISVFPYFCGSWRHAMSLLTWYDPAHGVEVGLPLGVRPIRWYLDLSDDQSPFCSHEHDPDLPATYGRRVWALGFGLNTNTLAIWPEFADSLSKPDYQGKITDPYTYTRSVLGFIGLDEYKEWIVDWPEDPAKAVYPRAYATKASIERLKRTLDQHPDKDLLESMYLLDGKTESAKASANRALYAFTHPYVNDWKTFGLTAYIATYSYTFTVYAEDALACPELPAELRVKLRRMLALYAYLFAEPDRNPRGAGMHLGNPNMPIGRTEALVEVAPLLPDHPRYGYWMSMLKDYTALKLATMTEPGGAWLEPPTYQMYGPTRALSLAQFILRNSGYGDLAKEGWHAKALEYDANLTMPDVRFKGWRILPGMGNSGDTLEAVFGMAAGVVEQADPEEAGFFKTIHRLNSGNLKVSGGNEGVAYAFMYQPDVPEKPRPLTTKFVPGYGVAFRAHYGTPDETGMLFRCGFNKSHWDMDTNNTILYSKGAPLSPGTGYQYYYGPASKDNAIYHNRVKVGKIDAPELFGRCEDTILDYGFGDNVDYALGHEYFPPEYFTDGKGEMTWRRHVLFLKSAQPAGANYFVLRDTFPGIQDRQTWWHWLNLDGKEMISQQGNEIEMKTKYGAGTHFWFTEALPGKAVLTFDYNMGPNYHHLAFWKSLGVPGPQDKEVKTIYQLTGKPGGDYFYAVFPHKDGETLPTFAQAGDGCLKITTAEATDYAFVSDTPLNYDKDGILFTGKTGAVRIFPDHVVLSMTSGSGRVGYKGYSVEGHGPFERTVKLAELKPGVVKIDGGYAKQLVTKGIGGGITVTGEEPFEAKLDGENIRIHTTGRARVLQVTRPSYIWMPQFFLDGREWMAFWTDYAGSDWGKDKNTALISVSTLDGDHDLLVRNRIFRKVWDKQFTPMVATPVK